MPNMDDCWYVEGDISTVPATRARGSGDILVEFSGRHFKLTEIEGDGVERVTRIVRQTVRYRCNGKTYVLVTGTNPLPPI
jgi:hypothetical protein